MINVAAAARSRCRLDKGAVPVTALRNLWDAGRGFARSIALASVAFLLV